MDGTGTFEMLQAQTAALVESARKRGMSAAAIARLPKPIVIKRDVLPPVVLATKAHGTNTKMVIAQRQLAARRAGVRKVLRKPRQSAGLVYGRTQPRAADHELFDQIVTLVSESSSVSQADIRDFVRSRSIVRARHICWRLLREFTGLSVMCIARITDRACHTSTLHGISKAIDYAQTPEGAAIYWEVRTLLSAAGHLIVEDLEKKGGRPL